MRVRVAASVFAVSLAIASAASAAPFTVIVNTRVRGRSITKSTLSQVFLGRIERWADGRSISACDLSATSPARAAFSEEVLGMSVFNVKGYWLRQISNGRTPLMTRSTDAEVIAFVEANAGGIGYVSEGAVLPPTVKAVGVE